MMTRNNGVIQWQFKNQRYSSIEIWNKLREKRVKVLWRNLIWGKGMVPKHSCICWMVFQNKLPVADKLCSWGLAVSSDCVLYGSALERKDHVFLIMQLLRTGSAIGVAEMWCKQISKGLE